MTNYQNVRNNLYIGMKRHFNKDIAKGAVCFTETLIRLMYLSQLAKSQKELNKLNTI